MKTISIEEKLALISDYWNPRVAGELNGQQVKLVKVKGEFIWHQHEHEDELFFVLDGVLKMEFRDRTEIIRKGEMIIVPRGTEHRPVADAEVSMMLFEPASVVNTGDQPVSDRTRIQLEKI